MKKATIPIPYIIALILGIIVVAVLAYWFFISIPDGIEVVSEAECRASIVAYCLEVPVTGKEPDESLRKACGCSGILKKDENLFCNNFTIKRPC